jgi:hypothetical protein
VRHYTRTEMAQKPAHPKDRAAGLKRLMPSAPAEVSQTEREATGALYPKRGLQAQPHSRQEVARVDPGIDLGDLEAVIAGDPGLDETTRTRLLRQVHELAAYYDEASPGR